VAVRGDGSPGTGHVSRSARTTEVLMALSIHSILPLVLVALVAPSRGDEQKIPLGDVPKAVLDAVKAKFPHADLKEAAKEKEDNEVIYEISIVDQGKKIDVSVDEKGEIEKTETEIAISALPKAVTNAIEAKYPKATIEKAELVIEFEDGKEDERNYEAVIVTDAKKTIEVVLTPKGKIVEEEKKDGEKD
jgi:hypothetical protein